MSGFANNSELYRKTNLFGAWCGIFYLIILFVGWWGIAGFYPMHSPVTPPEEIQAFFNGNTLGIRFGMIMLMFAAPIFLFFTATMAECVSKVEGRRGPLTSVTLLAGYGNAMLTFYPPLWWLTAAFRPDTRAVELIYMLNDAAWLQFIGGLSLVLPFYISIALTILNDKSEDPVFPRWVAYLTAWTFFLVLPGQILFFFHDGPFAWNGLIAFWLPVTVFSVWFIIIAYYMRLAFKAPAVTNRPVHA